MRVLVTGGRDYADRDTVWRELDAIHTKSKITMLIHGDARGADRLADEWAREQQKRVKSSRDPEIRCCPADWKRYGPSAGPIRNGEMLAQHRPELVVAFPGGRGTANMVKQAREAGVKVVEVGA